MQLAAHAGGVIHCTRRKSGARGVRRLGFPRVGSALRCDTCGMAHAAHTTKATTALVRESAIVTSVQQPAAHKVRAPRQGAVLGMPCLPVPAAPPRLRDNGPSRHLNPFIYSTMLVTYKLRRCSFRVQVDSGSRGWALQVCGTTHCSSR